MRLYLPNQICYIVMRCLSLLLGLTIALQVSAAPVDVITDPVTSPVVSATNGCGLLPPVLTPSSQTVVNVGTPVGITATGCPGGIIQYFGSAGVYTVAPGGTISVPTSTTGVMIVSALCSFSGCTSDVAVATVTVVPSNVPSLAPVVANAIPNQNASVGSTFVYQIPVNTFSDPKNDQLTLTASGLPANLFFNGSVIIGPLESAGSSLITITATNSKGLATSASFSLNVSGGPVVTEPFAITGVTTVSCATLTAGERRLTFSPNYTGLTGQPVTFAVVNEFSPTTNPAPYTLNLYIDNPVVSLQAVQAGTANPATFTYNWLAACNAPIPPTTPFAITAVTTVSCTTLAAGQRQVTFSPNYSGKNGQPISFSVFNELSATTAPGPYTLNLYTDNPVINLQAVQVGTVGAASFQYNWLAACGGGTGPNTAPTVATPIPSQTATVGQYFAYTIPSATFADAQTASNQLTLAVSGLPAGLTFTAPATISGTVSTTTGSPFTVTVKATDPGSLSVATTFLLTVKQASATVPFSITGVTTVSCMTVTATQRALTYTPQYVGVNGQTITFAAVNESMPTTSPGPYTLNLYTDNPTITLQAIQAGSPPTSSSFQYNWLAACGLNSARVGVAEKELSISILGNPTSSETVDVEIRGAAGQTLQLRTIDSKGQNISESSIQQAGGVERATVRLGRTTGFYFLQATTPTQRQVVKILKQ
ncbi:putative Ig domain-containing protein [Spirosoma agri]|uniref:Dystroglycan-type cadherin-like domain-containing protein n=1 Tax=Spirosoma agri TaxID=1987381 RepID=A0A6M0IH03_9BACT|nr:putative Ig domain-containing protein [Spirosoma agri]NEU67454.1 hypothetical protein [Spirosoma agri]